MRGMGNAQHGIVGGVKMAVGEFGRIAGHKRDIAGIGQIDQRLFGGVLDRIAAPGNFDIQPV